MRDTLCMKMLSDDEEDFIRAIAKADVSSLNDRLRLQCGVEDSPLLSPESTVLTFACCYRSEQAFLALIKKTSFDTISELLSVPDNQGRTVLDSAARYRREASFLALIERASSDSINSVLLLKDSEGRTALGSAARYQSEKAFLALFDKVDIELINRELALEVGDTSTAKQLAEFLSPTAFAVVFKKLAPDTVKVLMAANDFLSTVICSQDTANFYDLIEDLDLVELSALLNGALERVDATPEGNTVYKSLAKHLFYKMNEKLLASIGPSFSKLYPYSIEKIPSNPELTSAMISYMLKKSTLTEKEIAILTLYQEGNEPAKKVCKMYSESRSDFPLPPVQLSFFRAAPQEHSSEESKVRELIESHHGLLKIINPYHWNDMLEQLKDYTYRPALRLKTSGQESKYVHATGEIVSVAPEKKKKEAYHSTKKNSATLLSPLLTTPTVGSNTYLKDKLHTSVGLLFDSRHCEIKGMFRENMTTYQKQWVSSFKNAQTYANSHRSIVFTDLEEFKEATLFDKRLNEVLAKFTREALVAVVIVNDTPEEHKVARRYALGIYNELHIDLPIYRYDCIYGVMEKLCPAVSLEFTA